MTIQMICFAHFYIQRGYIGVILLGVDVKLQYICTLVCEESWRQFELLYDEVEGKNPLTV